MDDESGKSFGPAIAKDPEQDSSERELEAKALTERRHRALELRLQHRSYPEIAADLGVDLHTAWDYVQWILKHEAGSEDAEMMRALEVRRIDMLCAGIWSRAAGKKGKAADGSEDEPPDDFAIDRWAKLSKRRGELTGIDAPEKHEIMGAEVILEVVGTEVTMIETTEALQLTEGAEDPDAVHAVDCWARHGRGCSCGVGDGS